MFQTPTRASSVIPSVGKAGGDTITNRGFVGRIFDVSVAEMPLATAAAFAGTILWVVALGAVQEATLAALAVADCGSSAGVDGVDGIVFFMETLDVSGAEATETLALAVGPCAALAAVTAGAGIAMVAA